MIMMLAGLGCAEMSRLQKREGLMDGRKEEKS